MTEPRADGTTTVRSVAEDWLLSHLGSTPLYLPEDYGAVGDDSHDDTAAMQACFDAAIAADADVIVSLDPTKTYRCDAAPRCDRSGNCILSIADAPASRKRMTIVGGPSPTGWAAQQAVIKTTRTGDAYSANYGPPSVIGGATDENGRGIYQWTGPIVMRGLRVEVPCDPEIAGIDGLSWGGVDLEVTVQAGDGTGATKAPSHPHAFGIRLPSGYGFGVMRVRQATVLQMYAGYVAYVADHIRLDSAEAYKCVIALAFQDPWGLANHAMSGDYLSVDRCLYALAGWSPTHGVKSLTLSSANSPYIHELNVDIEDGAGMEPAPFNYVATVLDANNVLYGRLRCHYLGGLGVDNTPGPFTGGQNLKVEIANTSLAGNVASAATIRAPIAQDVFKVTGTTQVNVIDPSYPGRRITIIFTSTAAIGHLANGGNIKLNGSANFTGPADRSLTLTWDGTYWQEVSRKVP